MSNFFTSITSLARNILHEINMRATRENIRLIENLIADGTQQVEFSLNNWDIIFFPNKGYGYYYRKEGI